MPDGLDLAPDLALPPPPAVAPAPGNAPDRRARSRLSTRHRRSPLVGFLTDAVSERTVRGVLADLLPAGADIRRGGIRAAIAAMQTEVTPGVLVVDISGEDQPLSALAQLANVVEPDVCVLVVGEVDSVDFYREVTRSLGAHEYLTKPLTSDKVSRHIGSLLGGESASVGVQGGSMVIVSGVKGGVGATTLAVNLAGHFGISMHRHTVLLDPDLQMGDAAFLLNVKAGPGLRMALETPGRVDALLAERAAQPAADRLHVLAGEEALTAVLNYAPAGAAGLVGALRRRYNFIVADVPFRPGPLYTDLLAQPHQRVLVMLPTLSSVRATLRLLTAAPQPGQAKRPVIVLNRLGLPNGLTRKQVEDALGAKVEVTVADQPREVASAAMMGELAVTGRGAFRGSILEIARHVASVGLLDSSAGAEPVRREPGPGLRRWFRRG